MIARIAARNLRRHPWRSALTAGGIAIGVGMLLWTHAFTEAFLSQMVRGATAVDLGQIQVRTQAWADRPSIYDAFDVDEALLERIAATDGVVGVSRRIYAFGLVGNERRSQVARLVGVSPPHEAATTLLVDGVSAGRWLADEPAAMGAPREVVVGATLARQLDVGPGDELVVFTQAADGSLGNDLLTIVGLVHTGNTQVDRMSAFMHIDDLAWQAALEGRAHELAIATARGTDLDEIAERVRFALGDAAQGDGAPVVFTWKESMRELAAMVDTSRASIGVTYFIVYALVALGLVNTQRMSAFERTREFGVLMGIGMRPRAIGMMVVAETVFLTAIGAAAGTAAGLALALRHQARGLNLAALTGSGSDFSFMGVAFSGRMSFQVTPASAVEPALTILVVAVACGLIPAWRAMRIDPIRAISGRI